MKKEDSDKITRLYEIYEQPMYRIAYAVLHDSGCAEDAVSESFIRIIKKINRIGEPDSPRTKRFILKIIKNAAIDQYRKNKITYERQQPIEEEHNLIPDESADIESALLKNEPPEFFDNLSETDRQIIILRFDKQMSWREVAEKTSLTESNVRKRFERIRKSLRGSALLKTERTRADCAPAGRNDIYRVKNGGATLCGYVNERGNL